MGQRKKKSCANILSGWQGSTHHVLPGGWRENDKDVQHKSLWWLSTATGQTPDLTVPNNPLCVRVRGKKETTPPVATESAARDMADQHGDVQSGE